MFWIPDYGIRGLAGIRDAGKGKFFWGVWVPAPRSESRAGFAGMQGQAKQIQMTEIQMFKMDSASSAECQF